MLSMERSSPCVTVRCHKLSMIMPWTEPDMHGEGGAFTIVHNEGRLLHFDNHLTMGGIACAMSHRLALQAVVQHPTAAHLDINTGLTQILWRHLIWRLFDNVAIQSEGCQALPFIRQMPLYSCGQFTVIIYVDHAHNIMVSYRFYKEPMATIGSTVGRTPPCSKTPWPKAKWGIILEDDVLAMLPNAEEVVAKTIATLPSDWDALFLGYHDDAGRPHPGISNGMVNDLEVFCGIFEVYSLLICFVSLHSGSNWEV